MSYWLMKCEPNVYSIDDLANDGITGWEGVRNYQVRNMMRDQMAIGDRAFFYHSNADPSGIAGTMTIARAGYPDPFQFDPLHKYFDPKSRLESPIWMTVDVQFESKLPRFISLTELRSMPELATLEVLKKGSRLSILPVTETALLTMIALATQPNQAKLPR